MKKRVRQNMKKYKPQKKYVKQIFIKIYFNVRQNNIFRNV